MLAHLVKTAAAGKIEEWYSRYTFEQIEQFAAYLKSRKERGCEFEYAVLYLERGFIAYGSRYNPHEIDYFQSEMLFVADHIKMLAPVLMSLCRDTA